jgi:MFS family permease
MSASRRWLVLGVLYFAQGLPFGFFTQALPVRLREDGASLSAIGLTSLLAAPWALKWLVAPLLDRFGSRRRWIEALQLAASLVLLLASFLPPERGWTPVLVAVLITNALAATQDVATDALAIELLPHDDRGLANGVQVAGYRVGMMVGGGALLVFMAELGWMGALQLLALGSALSALVILGVREPARVRPARAKNWGALLEAAKSAGAGRWLLVLFVYKSGDALATAMLRPMIVDGGLDAAAVGAMLGKIGFGAGLVGALLGGWLVPRLGRGHALVTFGVLQSIGIGTYALVALGAPHLLGWAIGLEHLAGGMATAALFTCMMDACRPGLAATDYALQASVVVLSTGLAAALSGLVAEGLGYAGCFATAALVSLVGAALADALRRRRELPLALMRIR